MKNIDLFIKTAISTNRLIDAIRGRVGAKGKFTEQTIKDLGNIARLGEKIKRPELAHVALKAEQSGLIKSYNIFQTKDKRYNPNTGWDNKDFWNSNKELLPFNR